MECVEGVDGSRNAVEADALKTNLSDELGILDGRIGIFGGSDAMKDGKRIGRVKSKGSSSLKSSAQVGWDTID